MPPFQGSAIGVLQWGVFCGNQPMDREPAPDTVAGWVHVPRGQVPFHWEGLREVPAAIGMGFGIRASATNGPIDNATIIMTRPGPDGHPVQESWTSSFQTGATSFSFFRFDTPDELQPGPWDFQIYKDGKRLAQVGFTVLPAESRPGMVNACRGEDPSS